MKKNPGNYIAQPLIELSSHPTYVDGKLRAAAHRPAAVHPLRREGSRVLPGGLTRVALRPGSYVVNSSQGGGSKDTWVLAPREGLMLSRVADALYWMGRYLERAENLTRLLLVTEDFSTEMLGLDEHVAHAEWKDLLAHLPRARGRRARPPPSLRCRSRTSRASSSTPRNPYSVIYLAAARPARTRARSGRR